MHTRFANGAHYGACLLYTSEALQRISYTEYLLDILLYGEIEEKAELIAAQGKEVLRLEQRISELAAGNAGSGKKDDGHNGTGADTGRNPGNIRGDAERPVSYTHLDVYKRQFISFSGYLLIYNILYVSVVKDVQFYGRLKTIGTTQRQKMCIRDRARPGCTAHYTLHSYAESHERPVYSTRRRDSAPCGGR